MSQSHWRDIAAPIIARVLKETAGKPESEIKAALFAAYPFGERAMHPYKIWLNEIKKQRARIAAKAPQMNDVDMFGGEAQGESSAGSESGLAI